MPDTDTTVREILAAHDSITAVAHEHRGPRAFSGSVEAARRHQLDFNAAAIAAGMLARSSPTQQDADPVDPDAYAAGILVGVLVGLQIAHERSNQ